MATSRTEDALGEIITEFGNISTANGYRNDVDRVINSIRPLDRISDIEIGIQTVQEDMIPLDDAWTVFDTVAVVFVQGVISTETTGDNDNTALATATESLRHDIKRVIYKIMKKYINAALSKWNVTPKQQIRTYAYTHLGENRNKGAVYSQFTIRIRTQGSTFIDNADAQDFGTTGGGLIDGGSL